VSKTVVVSKAVVMDSTTLRYNGNMLLRNFTLDLKDQESHEISRLNCSSNDPPPQSLNRLVSLSLCLKCSYILCKRSVYPDKIYSMYHNYESVHNPLQNGTGMLMNAHLVTVRLSSAQRRGDNSVELPGYVLCPSRIRRSALVSYLSHYFQSGSATK
jgi:hypothetical protein